MAYYRKNKKRFDPRYFMDEKMEELLNEERGERPSLRIPASNPAADRWHREQEESARKEEEEKRKSAGPIDNNAGRIGQIPEGLENITPENIAIIVQAALQVGHNFAPAILIGALGMKLKDAIEYLKKQKPESYEDEEEWEEDDRDLLAMQYDADDTQQAWRDSIEEVLQTAMGGATGFNQQAAAGLYDLVDPRIEKSMKKIKDNSIHLGDIKLLKNLVRNREDITEEQKNLIRILNVLAGTQDQWVGEQSWESDEQEDVGV